MCVFPQCLSATRALNIDFLLFFTFLFISVILYLSVVLPPQLEIVLLNVQKVKYKLIFRFLHSLFSLAIDSIFSFLSDLTRLVTMFGHGLHILPMDTRSSLYKISSHQSHPARRWNRPRRHRCRLRRHQHVRILFRFPLGGNVIDLPTSIVVFLFPSPLVFMPDIDFFFSDRTPQGLEDVSKYPYLFAELLQDPTWTEEDLRKLAGLNFLRVFRQVEKVPPTLLHQAYIVRVGSRWVVWE